mmetsp:Transcript_49832/g.161162  ORF Transcript_49832/g.161162 Transcript_49832/m.161162 type:complete len:202 (+) Transcript_49832:5668-6273(+)
MQPELHEAVPVLQIGLDVDHEQALQHLRGVTQIEGVVALDRRGQKVGRDAEEHVNGRADDRSRQISQLRCIEHQPAVQDGVQNAIHGLLRKRCHPDHVEVPDHPGSDLHAAASRRSTCCDELGVGNRFPKQFLAVVESLVVDDLPQQLDRWLRPVRFEHRHVQVVNAHNHRLARRCAQQVLPLSLQAILQEVDDVRGRCLG